MGRRVQHRRHRGGRPDRQQQRARAVQLRPCPPHAVALPRRRRRHGHVACTDQGTDRPGTGRPGRSAQRGVRTVEQGGVGEQGHAVDGDVQRAAVAAPALPVPAEHHDLPDRRRSPRRQRHPQHGLQGGPVAHHGRLRRPVHPPARGDLQVDRPAGRGVRRGARLHERRTRAAHREPGLWTDLHRECEVVAAERAARGVHEMHVLVAGAGRPQHHGPVVRPAQGLPARGTLDRQPGGGPDAGPHRRGALTTGGPGPGP